MVLCSERTARCLGVILLGLALICFCVNILLFFPNGDPRYAKSNISGTVWYLSGVLGSGLLMIFPAYVFLVLWDDKGCKDCCADFRCGECDCEGCRDCQPCACCQSLQCPKCGDCQPCACCQSLQCPKCRDCQPCACCEDIHCPNCQECQPCKSCENCQCPPCRDCQPCRFCKDCECLRCRDCQLCKPCQACECPRCQDCDPIRACQECECKRLCECKPCQACECPDCRTCRQACDCRQCPEFPCCECCDWKQCKCPDSCTCPNLCENCQCQCQSQCMNNTCTWNNTLCSIIFTVIGLIGSAYCFIVSSVALDLGPFCRVTPLGEWKHPFHKGNYLNDPNLWVKCLEPENAIPWHVKLFSILLVVSAVQFIICVALLINILIGVICKEWNCFKGYGSI